MSIAAQSVAAVLRFAGVTERPEFGSDGLWWPSRRVGVLLSSSPSATAGRDGWSVVRCGADWAGWCSGLIRASSMLGAEPVPVPDPSMFAVHALLRFWGCEERPRSVSSGGVSLAVAWPDHRIAVVMPGESSSVSALDGLRRSGWVLHRMSGRWMSDVSTVRGAALAVAAAVSAGGATNPSGTEQKVAAALLDAFVAAGCPAPRRDVEVVDESGRVFSRPDFAWPEVMLVLEVDGWFHHSGRGLDVLFGAAGVDEARRAMRSADRSRFERDAIKRRRLAVLGWTVLTCSDTEIDRDGCDRVAADVSEMYRRLVRRR